MQNSPANEHTYRALNWLMARKPEVLCVDDQSQGYCDGPLDWLAPVFRGAVNGARGITCGCNQHAKNNHPHHRCKGPTHPGSLVLLPIPDSARLPCTKTSKMVVGAGRARVHRSAFCAHFQNQSTPVHVCLQYGSGKVQLQ